MRVELSLRVVAFETDYSGMVSNTRYIEYLERGRNALLKASGVKVGEVWDKYGAFFVVRRTEVDYLLPARHEDDILLATWVREHTGATTILEHVLTRPADGAILLRSVQTLAYLNEAWRPVRVPAALRTAMPSE